MSLQLKVSLDGSKPPIWRRLLIPDSFTFVELHAVIQAAMGWENAHLFSFRYPGEYRNDIGIPMEDDWMGDEMQDARRLRVRDHLQTPKQKMHYEYDFGDSWQHTVLLEKINDERILAPQFLKGKGACPPEDCGGIWGYYSIVESINDPKSPDHRDAREWLGLKKGERWDVEAFDAEECRRRVTYYQERYFDF